MIVVTLIMCIKNLFDIISKMHELHKAGVDKKVANDISRSVENVKDVVNSHYDNIIKKKGDKDDRQEDVHSEKS